MISNKLNLVLIITGLSTGGAEITLYKLLKNIDRSRFEPTVISLISKGEIGPQIESLGIPVYALGMSTSLPNPLLFLRLFRLLRQLRPAVVHTWMYHADLLGGMAAKFASVPDIIWGIHHSNLSKTENKRSTLAVVALCAKLSDWLPTQILSCSLRAKDVHAAVGYVDEKIHVIPNGFDLAQFAPNVAARADLLAELGLSPSSLLVGVVARFNSQKNHLGFVQAAAQVHSQLPQVHFVLAGINVDSTNSILQSAIAAHTGLAEHMHLLGRRDDIPCLMAAFDVLASPSHGEAFPSVLGEAMACGVPCVVTDAGDSAEIVGNTGRVVAVGDMAAMAQQLLEVLLLSKSERVSLGLQARERIQANYDIAHVTNLYQVFYERVAKDFFKK